MSEDLDSDVEWDDEGHVLKNFETRGNILQVSPSTSPTERFVASCQVVDLLEASVADMDRGVHCGFLFLVVGILGSYLPQHFKIVTNGSSAGLSPWWVLLGTLSSIAGLTNIVVLPTSQHDMACCHEISGAACGAAMLGVVQVGVQWTCFMAIMVLFLAFFPRQTDIENSQILVEGDSEVLPRPRDAVIVGVGVLVATLAAGVGSLFYIVLAPQ